MRDLGTLGGLTAMLMASTTPGRWWVSLTTAGGLSHAFITGPDGMGMRDLGTWWCSDANGINDAGQVVGYSATAGLECFHHRPRWDGHERPWHLRW